MITSMNPIMAMNKPDIIKYGFSLTSLVEQQLGHTIGAMCSGALISHLICLIVFFTIVNIPRYNHMEYIIFV